MQLKELELVDWESQDPENIGWGRCYCCWDEGHIIVVSS